MAAGVQLIVAILRLKIGQKYSVDVLVLVSGNFLCLRSAYIYLSRSSLTSKRSKFEAVEPDVLCRDKQSPRLKEVKWGYFQNQVVFNLYPLLLPGVKINYSFKMENEFLYS